MKIRTGPETTTNRDPQSLLSPLFFLLCVLHEHDISAQDWHPKRRIGKSDELSCILSLRKLVLTCLETPRVDRLTGTAPLRPCQTLCESSCPKCMCASEGHRRHAARCISNQGKRKKLEARGTEDYLAWRPSAAETGGESIPPPALWHKPNSPNGSVWFV